jgi:hypothetical protein
VAEDVGLSLRKITDYLQMHQTEDSWMPDIRLVLPELFQIIDQGKAEGDKLRNDHCWLTSENASLRWEIDALMKISQCLDVEGRFRAEHSSMTRTLP